MATINRSTSKTLTSYVRQYECDQTSLGPCGTVNYHYPVGGFSPRKFGVNRVSTVSNSTTPVFTEVVNSVSSSGFYSKKMVRVKWFPKKFTLSQPTYPRFNPPRLPVWVPPKVEPKSKKARAALEKRRKAFDAKYDDILRRRTEYSSAYEKRYAKYQRRLAKYHEYTRLKMEGVLKYRLRRVRVSAPQMNAYSRTRTWDTGVIGEVEEYYKVNYSTCGSGRYVHYFYFGNPLGTGLPWMSKVRTGDFGWGAPHTPGAAPSTALSSAESQAIARLHSNLKNATVHIGNMLAERRQTMDLLSSIVRKVASLITAKRSLVALAGDLIGSTKSLSNTTLAFQFGIRPLLSDAYSAGIALARYVNGGSDVFTVKSTGTSTDSTSSSVNYTQNPNWNCWTDGKINRQVTQTVEVRYVLQYRVSNGTTQTLSQLGLINPAEIAWEMLPWSFVIDWFLPLGRYIASLSSEAGVTFVSGVKTVVTTTEYQTQAVYKHTPSYVRTFAGEVNGYKKIETKVRTVLSAAPTPQFPSFENPFSVNHLIDALALARQKAK